MKKKKIIKTLAVLVFIFGLAAFAKTQAASVTGWLWGGSEEDPNTLCWVDDNKNGTRDPGEIKCSNGVIDGNETGVGRISMSCSSKVDSNGDGQVTDADEAMKVCNMGLNQYKWCNGSGITCTGGSCVDACSVVNYRVNMPSSGSVTDYAWSENIGWIQFNPAGPYPDMPNQSVQKNGSKLEGWARIVGIATESTAGNSGGWSGWIKMNGITISGAKYGVTVDDNTGEFCKSGEDTSYPVGCDDVTTKCNCYAWSGGSDELGWINFSGASLPSVTLTSGGDVELTSAKPSLPQPIPNGGLSWTVNNATNCTASCNVPGGCSDWNWIGGANSTNGAHGPKAVDLTQAVVMYRIDCDAGVFAEATVHSYCNDISCNTTTEDCEPSPPKITSTYVGVCQTLCTDRRQCEGGGGWKEINP